VPAPPPERLPHTFPFRLVERAEVLDEKRVALVLATSNTGLLPRDDWPVTLIAEALAQAILIVSPPPKMGDLRLVGLNRVRLLQPVRPGSRLEVEVELLAVFPPLRRYSCRAHLGGALAATAEVTVSA